MRPLLARTIHPGMRVLDAGCGSGLYTRLLLERGASVVGVDYSPQMLRLARPRIAPFAARGALVLGDAGRLMFREGAFDAALAVGLLDYVPDAAGCLAELARVTTRGGRVIVTIPRNPSPFFFLRWGPGRWLRRRLLGLPPVRNAMTATQWRALLAGARLVVEELDLVQGTMWIASATRAAVDGGSGRWA